MISSTVTAAAPMTRSRRDRRRHIAQMVESTASAMATSPPRAWTPIQLSRWASWAASWYCRKRPAHKPCSTTARAARPESAVNTRRCWEVPADTELCSRVDDVEVICTTPLFGLGSDQGAALLFDEHAFDPRVATKTSGQAPSADR